MTSQRFSRQLRRRVRMRAERVLDRLGLVEPRAVAPVSAPSTTAAPTPVAPPTATQPAPAAEAAQATPSSGGFTHDDVANLLDEMVRPALQADGGDLTLVKVEGSDVYVRLVGACKSCPSSVMTMKMGIERLLREELEDFGELIQLGDYDL